MTTTRLEAFSDAVLAIVITIMVLELHPPDEPSLSALWHETGVGFLTYVLSFAYIGIYWNNHHHLFQLVDRVTGPTLWANLHLMFWLSMYPFTTRWMDESDLARTPVIVYGVNLILAALAYLLLEIAIKQVPDERERLRTVLAGGVKENVSVVLYVTGIVIAVFLPPWVALVPFGVVALVWFVPDRRVERYLANAS
ncbi:DUF1211 domain-containing protein [Nocardioides mangrovicus]|uniref:DUF1211 domain-containing protein n=1 Tax=Nocardioides mangrovicus TaxID=2478913 RepID=A0A3L8P761_9ACTN|nr:TMEM175 family protein [Nocardioides mangrovicus]RLV51055.1 DUF1211 domain-containing protein [Nocardioides mangrovicus]